MRLFTTLSLLLILLAAPLLPAHGALPKARPAVGTGLLIIRSSGPIEQGTTAPLVVYREPAIGRIKEMPYGTLPSLSGVIVLPAGEWPVAVLGKKGSWVKIAYDGAGREGWLDMARGWDYIPWDDFLPGRTARLLPGLKKQFYPLRQQPEEAAAEIETLPPQVAFRIVAVSDGWARVTVGPATSGWLRWRDGNGRFLISDCAREAQQKD